MNDIKELIHLLDKQINERLPFLHLKAPKLNKEEILYSNILSGRYTTDEEAALGEYGNTLTNSGQYIMLKSRLKRRLLNHLLFLKEENLIHRTERYCHLSLQQAQTLILNEKISLARIQLKEIEKTAKEMEFTGIVIACLEKLNFIYAHRKNSKEYENNRKLLRDFYFLEAAERESEDLFLRATNVPVKSVQGRSRFLSELDDQVSQLETLHHSFPHSYNLLHNYLYVKIYRNGQYGDYEANINEIKRIQQKAGNNEFNVKRSEQLLAYSQYSLIYAYLRTRRYQEAYANLETLYSSTTDHTWFANLENYFLLAMHSHQYGLASNVLQQALENTQLPAHASERWRLYEAYLVLVNPETEKKTKDLHHFEEFTLSEIKHSTDKQGYHIALLILKLLHLLKKNERDTLAEYIESLRKYSSQHIAEKEQHRVKTMFKMFQILLKENFDAQKCKLSGKDLLTKLANSRPPGDVFAEIEVIPYELVWVFILEQLEKNFLKNSTSTTYFKSDKSRVEERILFSK